MILMDFMQTACSSPFGAYMIYAIYTQEVQRPNFAHW